MSTTAWLRRTARKGSSAGEEMRSAPMAGRRTFHQSQERSLVTKKRLRRTLFFSHSFEPKDNR